MAELPASKSPASSPTEPRRGFMTKLGAMFTGGLVGIFPFMAGLVAVTDPLRRSKGEAREIRVATLDALPDDGVPRAFPVVSDRQDAWTHYPPEPIGAVYLIREPGQTKVRALNATCPHAGCFVGYLAAEKYFRCPCHTSAFDCAGKILTEVSRVSPRDMDELECDVREAGGAGEIWVKFQNFQTGIKEKIAKA